MNKRPLGGSGGGFWKIIALVVAWIFIMSFLASVVVYQITSAAVEMQKTGGAKPAIERLWCGKEGCMEGGK